LFYGLADGFYRFLDLEFAIAGLEFDKIVRVGQLIAALQVVGQIVLDFEQLDVSRLLDQFQDGVLRIAQIPELVDRRILEDRSGLVPFLLLEEFREGPEFRQRRLELAQIFGGRGRCFRHGVRREAAHRGGGRHRHGGHERRRSSDRAHPVPTRQR